MAWLITGNLAEDGHVISKLPSTNAKALIGRSKDPMVASHVSRGKKTQK